MSELGVCRACSAFGLVMGCSSEETVSHTFMEGVQVMEVCIDLTIQGNLDANFTKLQHYSATFQPTAAR
jgi:hypothetical protein